MLSSQMANAFGLIPLSISIPARVPAVATPGFSSPWFTTITGSTTVKVSEDTVVVLPMTNRSPVIVTLPWNPVIPLGFVSR